MKLISLFLLIPIVSVFSGKILLENFEKQALYQLPKDYDWYNRNDAKPTNHKVREETLNGKKNRYLNIQDSTTAVTIYGRHKWDINKFPVMTWKWRANHFPEGSNESKKGKKDSPCGFYVILDYKFFKIPYILKYIWSDSLSEGTVLKRSRKYLGVEINSYVIVVESGRSNKGKWISEKRNVLKDFMKHFDFKPRSGNKTKGVGFLTDANSTKTFASGDYDDIYISSK